MNDASPYIDEYVVYLKRFLRPRRSLKVVFDCSSGSTGPIIERLFRDSVVLNGWPDGSFPHHSPDPLHEGSMDTLAKRVVRERADLGVIFDADGDRAFFIDGKGRFVNTDVIAFLLVRALHPDAFVYDVRAGWLVKRTTPAMFGAKGIESRVGHYFIKQIMRKRAVPLGCETSGHYYYKDFFYADSGIMTAVQAVNAIAGLPYGLADLVDLLPPTHKTEEINIRITSSAEALLDLLRRTYGKRAVHVSTIDGITMTFTDPEWWFNVRFSNTEPLVRINMEAHDETVLARERRELTDLVKKGRK